MPMTGERRAAARAVGATKVYGAGAAEVRAIDDVSVEFAAGRFTAVMGPSGAGKSTLSSGRFGERFHGDVSSMSFGVACGG